MQMWMLEADIYRLTKAWREAEPQARTRIAVHLRRAEALLVKLQLATLSKRHEEGEARAIGRA